MTTLAVAGESKWELTDGVVGISNRIWVIWTLFKCGMEGNASLFCRWTHYPRVSQNPYFSRIFVCGSPHPHHLQVIPCLMRMR